MAALNVAFWNVHNLFEPGTGKHDAPITEYGLVAKVDRIASVLDGLFEGKGADLIGLAEIHTPRIVKLLAGRLRDSYHAVFEPCRYRAKPAAGLTILARKARFRSIEPLRAWRLSEWKQPRWLVVRCEFEAFPDRVPPASFLFIVNHWTSRVVSDFSPDGGHQDRMDAARALYEWLRDDGCMDSHSVVVLGDFNAEPFEAPFGVDGLNSRRHLHPRHTLPSDALYNTAWRFLAEPDLFEQQLADSYRASRPKTTFDTKSDWHSIDKSVIFDQMLVSKRALRGGSISLLEGSVTYVFTEQIGLLQDGHSRPKRWCPYDSSGASDHFPLIAQFHINPGVIGL